VTPRIEPLDLDAARAAAAVVGIPEHLAELSVFRVALHSPNVASALHGMLHHLLFESAFDARRRELIIMRLGWTTGSVYEWTQHWRVAGLLGVDLDDVLAVREWRTSERFDATDRALLAATDEVLTSGSITEQTWAACAALLDDASLVELVAIIANWRLFATILLSWEVPLEEGVQPWPPDGRPPSSGPLRQPT
jgi:alkylhydroperoxidase family enzyme